jgi:hypothetical protein
MEAGATPLPQGFGAVKHWVQKYIDEEISPSHLNVFKKLFLGALILQLLRDVHTFTSTIRHKPFYNPIPILRAISPARPEAMFYDIVLYALVVVLILTFIKPLSRFFLWISLILCFWVLGVQLGLDKAANSDYVFHSKNIAIFILFILAVAPTDCSKRWPLTLLRLTVAMVYFGAGVCKLIATGPKWMDGVTLQAVLFQYGYLLDRPRTLWLGQQYFLCVVLSVMITVFELSFLFFALRPRLSLVFAFGGLVFHVSILYYLGINFLSYHGLSYLIFLVGGMSTVDQHARPSPAEDQRGM